MDEILSKGGERYTLRTSGFGCDDECRQLHACRTRSSSLIGYERLEGIITLADQYCGHKDRGCSGTCESDQVLCNACAEGKCHEVHH
ncbi:uncharacterized protein F4822DRAFT_417098 [Hypoxylon trugodes]|uniref:uncharacterized protein n=1 Tax=Hypoxylon trugodes TaxID=326681 RepID=UPI002191A500|nr:uncharacterized protein F4822DRAFT_417098 [Hypoxylon trugodes]KAI1385038.1 hypothetical protein F4822DRAFT_417098 [Hypoxylon trugodes]